MLKRFLRTLSVLLSLVMLFNMIPLTAVAEEYFTAEATELAKPVEVDTSEAKIVAEVKENRSKFSKEFMLDNGLYVSAVYAQPVHYEVDGQWQEIDNTLQVHSDGTYSNKAGVWEVRFPQQLTKSSDISITKDGYTLSFRMSGELRQPGNLEVASDARRIEETEVFTVTAGGDTSQTFSVQSAQNVQGKVQPVDLTEARKEVQFEEFVLEKNVSQLIYTDVYQNTDIRYDLKANQVKESVILESYNSALRGYRYTLDTGSMIPVLQTDNSIYFYDANQENVIMVMPAPYLVDSAYEVCYDIVISLTQDGSVWTLSYLLPQIWLGEKDRSWPVVLDPVVEADLSDNNVLDNTIMSARPDESNYISGVLNVGCVGGDGISRTLLGFVELPQLKSSDVLIKAELSLYKVGISTRTLPITVHKMLDPWLSRDACWEDNYSFDPTVEDYAMVGNEGRYYWDVTDIVRFWYEDENLGMILKATDEIENSGNTTYWKQFYSSDFGNNVTDPSLVIFFRNNNGLESYWDYTTVSAGEAGTGYINNYTGNFIWVHNDIGFGGNRMPVSIQHIYNLNDINKDLFGLGYGWRTNYNQRVYQWSENSNYYVWEDSDGTDHYFYYDSANTYKDEDGLELTLTNNGSGTQKYCIEDKNGNKSFFDTYGRLTKLQNNQATPSCITVTYTTETGYLISQITDGAGRVYQFLYDSGNDLEKIRYLGTGSTEIDSVSFDTVSAGPVSITGTGGEQYSFEYDIMDYDDLLCSVRNYSDHEIKITYNEPLEDWQPYRVESVCEYDGAAKGGELSIKYANNQTVFTDHNGRVEIHQFNNFGNLLSIQDGEGRAQFTQYANNDILDNSNTNRPHQLQLTSKLQNSVGNLVQDSSFENQLGHYCSPASTVVSFPTTYAYSGRRSLCMTATQHSYLIAKTFTVQPGETYTFSAYVKLITGSAHIILAPAGNFAGNVSSEILTGSSDWTRLQTTYTNTSGTAVSVDGLFWCVAGTQAYFDCAQIEKAPTASRYNLIENGDFRYGSYGWYYDSLSGTDGIVTASTPVPAAELDSSAIQIAGSPTSVKHVYQFIWDGGNAGDTFVLSGWAKGTSVPISNNQTEQRQFYLALTFNYIDGTISKKIVKFNTDVNSKDAWQYASGPIVADKAYTYYAIDCLYDYNANTVFFDGIQLFKEEFGSSYTYDGDGNVISVRDLQGKTTNYEYNTNGDLTKILQDNKAKMTYTYDNYHNVTRAVSEEGIVYEFTYDTYGNNTSVAIVSGDGSKITTSAAYTQDGNRMVSSTDALGNVTKYSYNANTNMLEWVQYPNDTDGTEGEDIWDTRTHYSYDSMYRLTYADVDTNYSSYFYADYCYDSYGYLCWIETISTWYDFYYGDFGLRTSVEIGGYTLAEYSYTDDRNYYLETLDYGNGDSIQYEYDDMGRVTKQTYEDGETVTYQYDNNGALATVTDSETGIKTTYYYDFTDRVMKYVESGDGYSHCVGYEYDQLNNLTSIVDTINGTTRTTSYSYDEDNRIESVITENSSTSYSYDGFGRVSQEQTKDGENVVLTDSYTFHNPT
ncbi:MAG: hypothetical protein IKK41_01140, partial [Oscillospiraceae bacterium]|nr:hypothetical protein [Oscillospiraceae bacterium]